MSIAPITVILIALMGIIVCCKFIEILHEVIL